MMQLSISRPWIERVMEVDDRDITILDLDPKNLLTSQIGDECKPALTSTAGPTRVRLMN